MDDASVDSGGRVRFEEFGQVLEWSSLADLAADYWRYQRLADVAKNEDDMLAWACVHDLVGEPAWIGALDLIDVLLAQASNDDEIAFIAAGPLEELVSPPGQGPLFIAGVETVARQSSRWSSALAGVWLDRSADPDVNRRLAVFGARHADGQHPS